MSVLCSRIPNMALSLATRHQPGLSSQPVALIGRDNEVCSVSAPAYQAGVRVGMNPRQAKMRCAEVTILEADVMACQNTQEAFLSELDQWELPVEPHGMGMAYVDLHEITTDKNEVKKLAGELGRRLRRTLGEDLQPSGGWDHSKFCARAAAYHTPAGRMKLVAKEDEVKFLSPLPVSYLPLSARDIQRLHWLGIKTLGEFAALPSNAVWQQFGKAGQLAHQWAQGRDNRPVRNRRRAAWSPLEIAYETPIELLPLVMDSLMARLQPQMEAWSEELLGCTRLRLELYFTNRERRLLDLVWIEPVTQVARLRLHITNQFEGLNWPGALDRILITQASTAELSSTQLSLFMEPLVESVTLEEEVEPLKRQYGEDFFRLDVVDASHEVYERRVRKVPL